MNPVYSSSREGHVRVDGKFFRLGAEKFYLKGVTYGPFGAGVGDEAFASQEQTVRDFALLRSLCANTIRVYHIPPGWLLDLASDQGLKVLVDVPWSKHLCFPDSRALRKEALAMARNAAMACRDHSGVLGLSVANEIPAEIVRWGGRRTVQSFLDQLVEEVKSVDPDQLCTFANFPPTEFVLPRGLDFVTYNVYLHRPTELEGYLARLQTLAEDKPLVLGEFGMDSLGSGEKEQSDFIGWQIETAARSGLAGSIVFSFTDDWVRGGMPVEDWAFGLTQRDRKPKASFFIAQRQFSKAPHFPLPASPKVSVVVASFNGASTLRSCLESLTRLNYPDYEVLLVDDGSTDDTPQIAAEYPSVRCIQQTNLGLSAARNTGIDAATGEIIAFTDSDCRADEDWLYYLVGDMVRGGYAGIGGHNFLPPDDSAVAAAVMASPGGPAAVMITDCEAEHLPGCNMAFYKWALEQIGGFDPRFRKAGDDVDVCWRLRALGHRLGFSHSGFVWHYRRSTVKAYLDQQAGYGEAEAILVRKYPMQFNPLGNAVWHGRIYASSKGSVVLRRPMIYRGVFGSGFFQTLYAAEPSFALLVCLSLEYHVLVTGVLVLLSTILPLLWPLAATAALVSLTVAILAACQAEIPKQKRKVWSKPLVGFLFFLQPIYRGLPRYRLRLKTSSSEVVGTNPGHLQAEHTNPVSPYEVCYWANAYLDRCVFIQGVQGQLSHQGFVVRNDNGWTEYDLEIGGNTWAVARLTTATEELSHGRINLRSRLEARWSFTARLTFSLAVAVESLAVSQVAAYQPWVWMSLLSLPLLMLWVDHQESRLLSKMLLVLNQVSSDFGMLPVTESTRSDSPPSSATSSVGESIVPDESSGEWLPGETFAVKRL